MTPSERLYTAISGSVPDRIPVVPKIWVDLAAALTETPLTKALEDPLRALRTIVDAGLSLGVDGVRQFHFPAKKVVAEGERVHEIDADGRRLGVVDMEGGLATHLSDPSDFDISDPTRMAYCGYWLCDRPFVRDLDDAKRMAVPKKEHYEELGCGDRLRQMREYAGDRTCLIGDCTSGTLAFHVCLRGMNRAMMDFVEEPALLHAVMEKGVQAAVERGKYHIDLGLRILRLNDSVANMSVISPKQWREFIFPHMKAVCGELHRYQPEVRVYCHICGNVLPILEDLIETGLDCIAPLDPLGGFSPADIRKVVGDRVSLMGGVNTLSFVESSKGEIADEARKCMVEAGRNGGFVLGSGCVIPRTAKRKNLETLVEAAREFGMYEDGALTTC